MSKASSYSDLDMSSPVSLNYSTKPSKIKCVATKDTQSINIFVGWIWFGLIQQKILLFYKHAVSLDLYYPIREYFFAENLFYKHSIRTQ